MAAEDNQMMACAYAALICKGQKVEITAENIQKVLAAAGAKVESYIPGLFCKAMEGVDIESLMTAVASGPAVAAPAAGAAGSAPAAEKKEEKKPEPEEEEDDDMGFGLFD